jgi:ABC-type transport system involved in cytochrome bd biosynthesis fused ATPase/permease subunit
MRYNAIMEKPFEIERIELLEPEVIRVLQGKTPRERIAMAFESNRLVRERLRAHLAHENPEWTDEQLARVIAQRMLHGTI